MVRGKKSKGGDKMAQSLTKIRFQIIVEMLTKDDRLYEMLKVYLK